MMMLSSLQCERELVINTSLREASSRKDAKAQRKTQRSKIYFAALLCAFASLREEASLIVDRFEHPDVDVDFFRVVEDGLSLWCR